MPLAQCKSPPVAMICAESATLKTVRWFVSRWANSHVIAMHQHNHAAVHACMASQSSPQRDPSESELRQLYDNEEAERFLHIFSTVSKPDIIKIVLFAKARSTSQRSGSPATQSGQTEKTARYPKKAMIPTGCKATVRRVLLPYHLCQKRWLWYDGLEASPPLTSAS
jgi:hypothetical protein